MLSRVQSLKKRIDSKKAIVAVLGSLIFYKFAKWVMERSKARQMRKKGQAKLQAKLSVLTKIPEISPEKKSEILRLKAYEIVHNIKSGKYTSEEVLYTYIERAQTLGRKYNLSAEEPFQDALSRLQSLPSGLLSGVPISIKDEIFQENCSSSGGLVWLALSPDEMDSILVKLLRSSGAVPFIRGNAMQLMMWFETCNNVYGRAENPWDPKRSPGGSSGGDAGLVACGATPLAIGSDIAGSIRIPAAYCGIYGFKPSSHRITSMECVATHPKSMAPLEILVKAAYGPLGKCVEDLVLVMQSWWQEALWVNDNMVVPLKFNNKAYQSDKKMRIGYFDYNNIFECAGVVKSIIRQTVLKLKNDGHELIQIKTDMFPKATELFIRAAFAMEGSFMLEELQGEDPEWPYDAAYYPEKYPGMEILIYLMMKFKGFTQLSELALFAKTLSYKEICILGGEVASFKYEFNQYWQSLNLDAAICPIWPLVAPLHGTTMRLAPAFSYSFFWNLLDFPAGVVPIKLVESGENKYDYFSRDAFVQVAKENMKDSVGLPVCIQVVGSTYQDEKVLKLMKIVQDYYKFHEVSPIPN